MLGVICYDLDNISWSNLYKKNKVWNTFFLALFEEGNQVKSGTHFLFVTYWRIIQTISFFGTFSYLKLVCEDDFNLVRASVSILW